MYDKLISITDHYEPNNPSPFKKNHPLTNFLKLAPRTKGTIFELAIEAQLIELGHDVTSPKTSEFDRYVDGIPTELKGATLSSQKKFTINQIHTDNVWDQIYIMCVTPEWAKLFLSDRKTCLENCKKYQHGKETRIVSIDPKNFFWLEEIFHSSF